MKGWGTPVEIALYVGRPVRTIRNWAASGAVPSACDTETKALMVHAASVRKHADERPTRKRLLSRGS